MRRPHYLPPNKSVELPSNCIWFDTETRYKLKGDGYEHHTLWFGWACYSRRRTDTEWTTPEWFLFKSIPEFWKWVFSKTRPRTRLYLFCHNGAFDLPVLDAFNILPSAGWEMSFAVVDAPPLIVNWRKGRETIKFVDTLNIWRLPLEKIGKQLNYPKLKMPESKRLNKEWLEYGKQDSAIIHQACTEWFNFLRRYDLGGFAATLASQSLNAFRHRFMDDKLLCHSNSKALELERAAYVGGRTECHRIGKYYDLFYHVDINSMYPEVMKSNLYPTELISVYTRVTLEELARWNTENCLIAKLDLITTEPVFPVVHDGRLVFPIGKLSVTLSTPEIAYALKYCQIIKIHKVAVYKTSRPFERYITELYTRRLEARQAGLEVDTWNLKIFMNSLYGKFGQRGRRYEIVDEVDNMDIEVWDEIDLDTGEYIKYRKFGGKIQRYFDDGESRHSMPAIAAHVTAYARMALWDLIKEAGIKNIYYCDTDCIVTNTVGYTNVSHRISEDILGMLKIEKKFKYMELNSPKDYRFGNEVKIKGIKKTAEKLNNNTFEQVKFVGMAGLLRLQDLSAPRTTKVRKVLKREYKKGVVNESGKVSPFVLEMF